MRVERRRDGRNGNGEKDREFDEMDRSEKGRQEVIGTRQG